MRPKKPKFFYEKEPNLLDELGLRDIYVQLAKAESFETPMQIANRNNDTEEGRLNAYETASKFADNLGREIDFENKIPESERAQEYNQELVPEDGVHREELSAQDMAKLSEQFPPEGIKTNNKEKVYQYFHDLGAIVLDKIKNKGYFQASDFVEGFKDELYNSNTDLPENIGKITEGVFSKLKKEGLIKEEGNSQRYYVTEKQSDGKTLQDLEQEQIENNENEKQPLTLLDGNNKELKIEKGKEVFVKDFGKMSEAEIISYNDENSITLKRKDDPSIVFSTKAKYIFGDKSEGDIVKNKKIESIEKTKEESEVELNEEKIKGEPEKEEPQPKKPKRKQETKEKNKLEIIKEPENDLYKLVSQEEINKYLLTEEFVNAYKEGEKEALDKIAYWLQTERMNKGFSIKELNNQYGSFNDESSSAYANWDWFKANEIFNQYQEQNKTEEEVKVEKIIDKETDESEVNDINSFAQELNIPKSDRVFKGLKNGNNEPDPLLEQILSSDKKEKSQKETSPSDSISEMINDLESLTDKKESEPNKESDDWVLDKLKEEFDIDKKDLIKDFENLSSGQKVLVLENLRNQTLSRIEEESYSEYKNNLAKSGIIAKIWKSITKPKIYQIAKHQKNKAGSIKKDKASSLNILKDCTLGTKDYGIDINSTKSGNGFKSEFDFTGALKTEKLRKETLTEQTSSIFNEAANRLSKIPYEYSFLPKSDKRRQNYDEAKRAYNISKSQIIEELSGKKEIDAKREAEIMIGLNNAETTINLNQFLTTHPDAKAEIDNLNNKSAISKSIFSMGIIKERGFYAGAGFAIRHASTSLLGLGAIVPVAALSGGIFAWRRAKSQIKEESKLGRYGSNKKGNERVIGYSEINKLSDRFNRLTNKLNISEEKIRELSALQSGVDDVMEKSVIEQDLAKLRRTRDRSLELLKLTSDFTKAKLEKGLVDFGDSKNRLSNQYELYASIGKAAVQIEGRDKESEYQKKLRARIEAIGLNAGENLLNTREKAKKRFITSQIIQGVIYGGSYAAAGWIFRDYLSRAFSGSESEVNNLTNGAGETQAPNNDSSPVSEPNENIPNTQPVKPNVNNSGATISPNELTPDPLLIDSNIIEEITTPLAHFEATGDGSIWQEAERQLEGRFDKLFTELGKTDPKVAEALRTYNIDRLKDLIINNQEKYNVHSLGSEFDAHRMTKSMIQNIDWDQAFKDEFTEGDSITNTLTSEQIDSIVQNNEDIRSGVFKNVESKGEIPVISESSGEVSTQTNATSETPEIININDRINATQDQINNTEQIDNYSDVEKYIYNKGLDVEKTKELLGSYNLNDYQIMDVVDVAKESKLGVDVITQHLDFALNENLSRVESGNIIKLLERPSDNKEAFKFFESFDARRRLNMTSAEKFTFNNSSTMQTEEALKIYFKTHVSNFFKNFEVIITNDGFYIEGNRVRVHDKIPLNKLKEFLSSPSTYIHL